MSKLVVQVCTFELKPHPNADRLELAKPDGMEWRCCVQKGGFEKDNLAVYIPIDSILPPELAEFLEPLNYEKGSGEPHRLRTMRLRGYVSQGMLIPLSVINAYVGRNDVRPVGALPRYMRVKVGDDLADVLGITKFVAPDLADADTTWNPAGFENFTDIQSFQTFADAIPYGMDVVLTEKIHGVAYKAAWLHSEWTTLSGKHEEGLEFRVGTNNRTVKRDVQNVYTELAERLGLAEKLQNHPHTQIYGELYGLGLQKRMHYNAPNKDVKFYGVAEHSQFLDYDDEVDFLNSIGLTPVPLLYRGPFSLDLLKYAEGEAFSGGHIREGFVMKPVRETITDQHGRLIVKVVNPQYQLKNWDADEVR